MAKFSELQSITVGDVKVTFLPDGGGIVDPVALYPASNEDGWKKYPQLLDDDGKFITTIGAFFVEVGDRKIAVDAGIGPVHLDFPGFGPFFGGKYMESFQKTGHSREDVTDVVFTHLHLDHCGWVTQEFEGERQLTFPNARYVVTNTEWEFWRAFEGPPVGPDPDLVQKPLANRLEMIKEGDTVAPGISVISTPGHTPGHISLLISSGGKQFFLLGDVLHGKMQLEQWDWNVAFDIDADTAQRTRQKLLDELIKPNTIVAAGHFSNGVFGQISKVDDKLQWTPV